MFAFAGRHDNQRKKLKSADGRRHRQSRAALRTRLCFEPLEERRLLTVITVNDLGDSATPQVVGNGKITLRDAILAANTNTAVGNAPAGSSSDIIRFATGLTGDIALTAGELAITGKLTIEGPGAANLTISGGGSSRIFNINDNNSASNLDVRIDGLTLTGGYSTANGGAIFSGEDLILSNSTLTGNSAAKGGGIWVQASDHGDTTIQNCTISENTATGDGGGIGVFAYQGTDTIIQNSTISENTGGGHGGGLYLQTDDSSSTTTIQNSTISGNAATGNGGGIWAQTYNHGALTLQSSTISGNTSGGQGGGISADTSYNSTTTIKDSAIAGNTSTGSGAGIYANTSYSATTNIQNNMISGNHAGGSGGGIWTETTGSSTTTIQTSTISGGNSAAIDGGGIWLHSYGGATIVQYSTVSGNTAAADGGGIAASTETDTYTYTGGTTTIQNSTVSGNTASLDGGGIWAGTEYDSTATLRSNTVSGNTAHGQGGGLYLSNYGDTTIQNSTVTGNTADSGGGGIYSSYYYSYYYYSTVSPTISSAIIAGNSDTSNTSPDLSGAVAIDHSLVGDNTGSGLTAAPVGSPDANGNLIGTGGGVIDPTLGPLANNGGLTNTHALLTGSPAIDMGAVNGQANDQRGFGYPRVGGAQADIGAYEVAAPTATPPEITVLDGGASITSGQVTPINVGSATKGTAGPSKTFTIRNDGQQTLILTMPFASTSHFTVGQPGTSSLAPGTTTTFTVTLKTGTVWTGSELVSIGSNDGDGGDGVENPFTFTVSGTVMSLHDFSTPGVYDPALSRFYLRNANTSGIANITFSYGPAGGGWIPLVGDWDGNGTQTAGIYDPALSRFYLRNANTSGIANVTFSYGPAGGGWIPLVGDWNGDGIDTVGLYDPVLSRFYLRNVNTSGMANITFAYGPAGGGWKPLVGDWNGDGTETVGLYDPALSRFYLRNANTSGIANVTFSYGPAGGGWKPLVGDWDADGTDTPGVYDPALSRFYLRNFNTSGIANTTFSYGPAGGGWTPLVGDWDGVTALLAAGGEIVADDDVAPLTTSELQPLVTEAIARWTAAGLSVSSVSVLKNVNVRIADLPGSYLGEAQGNTIYIDQNAAGHGWFVDPTPTLNEEFASSSVGRQLRAVDPRVVDRIDLLTVVEHELGHVLGLSDLDALADDLMSGLLGVGARRNASHQDAVDAILAY